MEFVGDLVGENKCVMGRVEDKLYCLLKLIKNVTTKFVFEALKKIFIEMS